MSRLCATLIVLCPAGAASAQSWQFTVSNDLSPSAPSATITLAAVVAPEDYAFFWARLSVRASEPGWSDLRLLPLQIPPMPVPDPDPLGRSKGEIMGSDVIGIFAGQLHIGPFVADPRSPLPVWEARFTTADFTAREIALSTATIELHAHTRSTTTRRAPVEGHGAIRIIPAPGALALLALPLAATRRRR